MSVLACGCAFTPATWGLLLRGCSWKARQVCLCWAAVPVHFPPAAAHSCAHLSAGATHNASSKVQMTLTKGVAVLPDLHISGRGAAAAGVVVLQDSELGCGLLLRCSAVAAWQQIAQHALSPVWLLLVLAPRPTTSLLSAALQQNHALRLRASPSTRCSWAVHQKSTPRACRLQ